MAFETWFVTSQDDRIWAAGNLFQIWTFGARVQGLEPALKITEIGLFCRSRLSNLTIPSSRNLRVGLAGLATNPLGWRLGN